jgi:hypothetical protein
VKSYYLVFGASGSSAQEVAEFIHVKTDTNFQQVGNFFRGWHCFTQVYVADNFSVVEQEWLEFEDQEFEVIIYVQTAHGKSKDRLSTHNWFKGWLSRYDKLTFLSEEILEDSEQSDSQ